MTKSFHAMEHILVSHQVPGSILAQDSGYPYYGTSDIPSR